MKITLGIVLFVIAFANAEESDNTMEVAINFVKDCKGDYFLCVKEKLLTIVDNLRATRSINIAEGVTLKGEPENKESDNLKVLPLDPSERDAEVNNRLLNGVVDLLETHSIEVKMDKADKESLQRSIEEGRGKKKKGGGMGGLIALLGAKVLLGKLFIVKLIALKALAAAKIALVLAAILFAAYCFKQDQTKTTYEVIPHAHHQESHTGYGYGSDWSKNIDEAQNLAYSGYAGHSK